MPTEFWSAGLQLGIGGLSVAGIIYVSLKHSDTTAKMQRDFLSALKEREDSMRQVETSVRNMLTEQITKNTVALIDVTRVLGRVVRGLDERK